MVASGVLKIHLVPTKKACYSYIIMDTQLVGITSWLQIIQFQLNAWPPEVILMEVTVNLLVPKKLGPCALGVQFYCSPRTEPGNYLLFVLQISYILSWSSQL